ncbi:MAG TPA: hypothetical protein VLA12_10495, partial [Planctomycetaceae bacterium]|nr:hypothetical protein [Planctomycetaceae bacterium]
MAEEKQLTKQQRDPHAGLVRCRNRVQQALGKIVYEQELKQNTGLDDDAKQRLFVDSVNQTRKDAAARCEQLTDEQVDLILTEDATDVDVLDIINGV